MSEVTLPGRGRVVDAVRSRFFFEDRVATGLLITVVMVWYLVQVGVLFLGWEKELIQWVFTTASFPALSPGLFLAVISHAFPPDLTHLFGNVAVLWVVAGECEQHMRRVEVIGFFAVIGLAAVLVGTAVSGGSTLGASGGALGFLGYYCIHMVLKHRDEFEFEALITGGPSETPLRTYWGLMVVLTPVVLVPYMLGQLFGLIPAGRADIVGHLTGFLCGVTYAVVRTKIGRNRVFPALLGG